MLFFTRIHHIRWYRAALFLLSVGLLPVCIGCQDDKPIYQSDIRIDQPPPAVPSPSSRSSKEIVFGNKNPGLAESMGASGRLGGAASKVTDPIQVKDEQYYAEADLYIALTFIKQDLDRGVVRLDLQRWLDDMRMKLSQKVKLPNDRSGSIQQVIEVLQEGLDAKQMVERFEKGGVNPDSLIWGLGRMDMERQLKSRTDLSWILPSVDSTWDRNRSLKEEILDYSEKFRSSPRQVMRERFDRASLEIERMSDLMGVKTRTNASPFSPSYSEDPSRPYRTTPPSIVLPSPVTRP